MRLTTVGLALRSVLWTLLLPGMIAGWIPWRYFGLRSAVVDWTDPLDWLGLVAVVKGAIILGTCVVEFARSGKGTLSPLDAPKLLVVRGLYRYVRNPMYVGVITLLIGESVLIGTWLMLTYTATVFVGFNVFVLGYEQPALTRMFGDQYLRYKAEVPMWIPPLNRRAPR